MDSGRRVSINFKRSKLTKVLQAKDSNKMTKRKEKVGVAAGAAAVPAAGAAAVPAAGAALPPVERRSGNNADIRSFLQAAVGGQAEVCGQAAVAGQVTGGGQVANPVKRKATPPRGQHVAKKAAQGHKEKEEEEEDIFEEAQEEMICNKREELRKKLMERAGLSPKQVELVWEVLDDILKVAAMDIGDMATDMANEATRAAADAAEVATNKKWEEDRCRRSILINNADKWVGHINNGFSLAENTTAQIHRLMGHAVLVLDAFYIGQWVDKKPPTSVFVTFGSVAQKASFFRVMAKVIQEKKTGWERISGISCRDAFPKERLVEAKRLTQKGFQLRQNGQVATFRVVAKGPSCIPTLEVRSRRSNKERGRWETFRESPPPAVVPPPPLPGLAGSAAATPPRGSNSIAGRKATPRKSLASEDMVVREVNTPLHMDDEMSNEKF